jgi:hypothetical protein
MKWLIVAYRGRRPAVLDQGITLILCSCCCQVLLVCFILFILLQGLSADMLATDLAEYLVRKGVPFRWVGEGLRRMYHGAACGVYKPARVQVLCT